MESDASKQGWGASCQRTNTGGPWTATEQLEHINYLEMKAAFLALLHREIISISTPSHGQCHSDCIPEQDGR